MRSGLQVAFSGYWLTDGRTAAVSIAARVDPTLQGQRIMDRMIKAKETFLRQYLPHDVHIRLVEVYNPKIHFAGGKHVVPHLKIVKKWVSANNSLSCV